MPKKLTTEEFIIRANKIHNNKYDYSNVNYLNSRTNINIKCILHGSFQQLPCHHLRGSCCPICSGNFLNKKFFKEKASKIHRNRYNYNLVKYKNNTKKVTIICKIHGNFRQSPNSHLMGRGCPKCKGENTKKRNVKSDKYFLTKCKIIHNNEYEYPNFNNVHSSKKISIICKKHGLFKQTLNHHSRGIGCPKCKNRVSKPEIDFLNSFHIKQKYRQYYIKPYNVDGYDPKTNTVYEFLGDYWHGNPEIYKSGDINEICKKSFGKLYNETINRFKQLNLLGYNIKYVWESDWKKFKRENLKNKQFTELENRGM